MTLPGVEVSYRAHSGVEVTATGCRVGIATAQGPDATPRFSAEVARPLALRDALCALQAVARLDDGALPITRGAPHSAAHRAYASWVFQTERARVFARDPLVGVWPDALTFETTSGDGRAWACVTARNGLFHRAEAVVGAARCDMGEALARQLARLRAYRETRLVLGPQGLELGLERAPFSRRVAVAHTAWPRFRALQRAWASGGGPAVELSALDLTLLLRTLEQGARAVGPRALRFELVRAARVRVVIEPSGAPLVLSGVWRGEDTVVRTWGRDALAVLAPLAPGARRVRVQLSGTGGPSFWSVEQGALSFTLGIAGGRPAPRAEQADEAGVDPFDGARDAPPAHVACARALEVAGALSTAELARAARVVEPEARAALVALCAAGRAGYDPEGDLWRARAWFGAAHADIVRSLEQVSKRQKRRTRKEGRSKEEATRARV